VSYEYTIRARDRQLFLQQALLGLEGAHLFMLLPPASLARSITVVNPTTRTRFGRVASAASLAPCFCFHDTFRLLNVFDAAVNL
jgi:hypothetical protein